MDLFEYSGYRSPQCEFNVYINGKLIKSVNNEEMAWEVIDSYPIGSLYEIRDKEGFCCEEFMQF